MPPRVLSPSTQFINNADEYKHFIQHFPRLSSKRDLPALLQSFQDLPQEEKLAAIDTIAQNLESMVDRQGHEASKAAFSKYKDELIGGLKQICTDEPALISQAIFGRFEMAEAAPGAPCRRLELDLLTGVFDESECPPGAAAQLKLFKAVTSGVDQAMKESESTGQDVNFVLDQMLKGIVVHMQKKGFAKKPKTVDGEANTDCVCGAFGNKKCGRCKVQRYCSEECQAADWARHKKVCKLMKKAAQKGETLPDSIALPPAHAHDHGCGCCHHHH